MNQKMNQTDILEGITPFKLNTIDLIRIQVEQRNLKKYNDLNNSDLSINITSNAYENNFFKINKKDLNDSLFKFIPNILIYEKDAFLSFSEINSNKIIKLSLSKINQIFIK